MFVIRDAQLDVLRRHALNRFVDQLVSHVTSEYPRHCTALGEEGTREFVQRVIRTAAGYEVTTVGAVAALVELMLQFGEGFERSPDRVWATNILTNSTLPDYLRVGAILERLATSIGGRVLVAVNDTPGAVA
jgi:hypothetical protein